MSFSHVKWLVVALVLNCWTSGICTDTESDEVMRELKNIRSLVTAVESRLTSIIMDEVKGLRDDMRLILINMEKAKCNCSCASERNTSIISDEDFLRACDEGDLEKVKIAMGAGANVNAKGLKDWTPLHYAANQSNSVMVCLFISNGAYLNSESTDGVTPLKLAEDRNATDVVRLLKDPEKCIISSEFLSACEDGRLEAVKAIMNGRSTADTINMKRFGNSCLHVSAMEGRERVVYYLLTQGWPVDQKGSASTTALHLSAVNGHSSTSFLLLEAGASVDAMNVIGDKAIHFACEGGHVDVVSLLFKAGAGIEDKGSNGMTPLHIAVDMNHHILTRYLIEKGADKTAQDDKGNTPLDLAKMKGYSNIIRTLEE